MTSDRLTIALILALAAVQVAGVIRSQRAPITHAEIEAHSRHISAAAAIDPADPIPDPLPLEGTLSRYESDLIDWLIAEGWDDDQCLELIEALRRGGSRHGD